MKRYFLLIALVVTVPLVMGMGAGSGEDIPKPSVEFRAIVVDDQGVETRCIGVAWEGEVFFKASVGSGVATIPFEKVRSVESLGGEHDGKVSFIVTLKDDKEVRVAFDEGDRFTGTTEFGTFRIPARNIKEIAFK